MKIANKDPATIKATIKATQELRELHAKQAETLGKLDEALRVALVYPEAWDEPGGVRVDDYNEGKTPHVVKRKRVSDDHEWRRWETDAEYAGRLGRRKTWAGRIHRPSDKTYRDVSALELAFLKGWIDDLEPEEGDG